MYFIGQKVRFPNPVMLYSKREKVVFRGMVVKVEYPEKVYVEFPPEYNVHAYGKNTLCFAAAWCESNGFLVPDDGE